MGIITQAERSRLVLAVAGDLKASTQNVGLRSREIALESVANLLGDLPIEALGFHSFETGDGVVRAEAAQLDGADIWTLRYSQPDIAIPGQEWIVEIASIIDEGRARFSCRLSLFSHEQTFDVFADTPAVLKQVCRQLTLQDAGFTFSPDVQHIGTDIDVTTLLKEITSPVRWWPCIIFSESEAGAPRHDADAIHRKVMGCANTYVLPDAHEMEFAAAVGYDFQVTDGYARLFRPGFDVMSSEIPAHPLIRPPAQKRNLAAEAMICAAAFHLSVERANIRTLVPSFAGIKQRITRQQSEEARAGGNLAEQLDALEALVTAERRNVEEAVALAIQSDEERQTAQAALAAEQAQVHRLKQRIKALEHSLVSVGGNTIAADPESFDDVSAWVSKSLSEGLQLARRAEKGLRSAQYERVEDVVAGLKLLAGPYRDMKLGKTDAAAFEAACREAGFEETRSVSKVGAGQFGDTYFVPYKGKKIFLDRHLKKGTSKDPRFCLRIYFFWDIQDEIVLVGSLPAHLKTGAS